jgi:hypothetical protein
MKSISVTAGSNSRKTQHGHSNHFLAWLVIPPAVLCLLSLLWPTSMIETFPALCGAVLIAVFFVSVFRFKDAFFIHANLFFLVFFFFFPAIFLSNVVFWAGAATYGFKDTTPITIACTWLSLSNLGYYLAQKKSAHAPAAPLSKIYGEAFAQADWFNIAVLSLLAIYFASMSSHFLMDRYQEQWQFAADITSRSRDSLIFFVFPRCIAFASFLLALLAFIRQSSTFRLTILVAAAGLWLAYNNPLSTAREILLSQGLTLALVLGLPQKRPLLFWCGMIFVLFAVAPTVSYFSREYVYSQNIAFFKGADFDVYQNSVAFSRYMSVHGFGYGEVILRDLSFWLPNAYKPGLEDLPAAVARANGYLQPNISMPVFDDFFADFGYVGLALLSSVTGYLLGICEIDALAPNGALHAARRLAILYLVASPLAILRGPLIGILPHIALGSGAILILAFASARSVRIRFSFANTNSFLRRS